MSTKATKWIQKAIKRPGQLHRDLGIPLKKKIPFNLLVKAAKRPGRSGTPARARLALRLRGFHKGRRKA